ncbi:MAG: ADP-glyceromanno-heptose 6-epimerase [Spirochaetes bacterium]|nr:ADP-glyceromanno-heptose 6-epimerase [Spirochaetota bacterium]
MIIVTGGAGFIGSAFIWKLNNEGIDDILVVDELGKKDKWKNLSGRRFNDYIHKDEFLNSLTDNNKYKNVKAVIHMGACSSTTETDADFLIYNNYRYSRELAKWVLAKNIRFIYASSAATYGDGSLGFSDADEITPVLKPMNIYGYSKHLFDLWAIRNKVLNKMAGIKFFNVFGPNEYHKENMVSMAFRAFHQVIQSGKVSLFKSYSDEYKDGEQKRDFVYIKDCVEIIWWLMNNKQASGLFNLGTGKARSWNDLVKAIFAAMGIKPKIEYIEMPESIRDRYQYFTEAKMDKVKKSGCAFNFMSLEDALNDYVLGYLLKNNSCL